VGDCLPPWMYAHTYICIYVSPGATDQVADGHVSPVLDAPVCSPSPCRQERAEALALAKLIATNPTAKKDVCALLFVWLCMCVCARVYLCVVVCVCLCVVCVCVLGR